MRLDTVYEYLLNKMPSHIRKEIVKEAKNEG